MKRAALLLLLASCATTAKLPDAPWTDSELVDVFVRWREAERRRDHDLAAEVLRFDSSSDRRFHEAEMEFLGDVEAGPIRTSREIHLAAGPRPRAPGEYLFLEPGAGRYRTAFVTSLNSFVRSAIIFREKTGQYLEDSASGQCPAGFEDYINQIGWEKQTPIGGVWDAELNSFGITSAIGVHFNGQGTTRTAVFMQQIDQIFDDGDLATGVFRQIAADRYYYIIRE